MSTIIVDKTSFFATYMQATEGSVVSIQKCHFDRREKSKISQL